MIGTGFLPKAINTPAKAVAVYLKGREMGVPFMQSMGSINVIEGKPTLSAELMLALCYRNVPGFRAEFKKLEDGWQGEFWRDGAQVCTLSFTRKDAEAAGLINKQNWRTYFDAMCRARLIAAGCRVAGPDAVMGTYTPDELGAVTDEEGKIVETEAEVVEEPVTFTSGVAGRPQETPAEMSGGEPTDGLPAEPESHAPDDSAETPNFGQRNQARAGWMAEMRRQVKLGLRESVMLANSDEGRYKRSAIMCALVGVEHTPERTSNSWTVADWHKATAALKAKLEGLKVG